MLWRPHHLIQARPNFDFLGKRKIAMVLSTVINVASLVGVFVFGLNFGIDFEGGIAIQVKAKQGNVQLEELRSTLGHLGVGEVSLQEFGDPSTALIRVQRQEGNNQCVANAERVMKRRAGDGWAVKPGPAGTGDVSFTAPNALDAVSWRSWTVRPTRLTASRQLTASSAFGAVNETSPVPAGPGFTAQPSPARRFMTRSALATHWLLPSWRWTRISAVLASPNSCSDTSPTPRWPKVERSSSSWTAPCLAFTWMAMPPSKSMPKLRPKTKTPTSEATLITVDRISAILRLPRKSKLVRARMR